MRSNIVLGVLIVTSVGFAGSVADSRAYGQAPQSEPTTPPPRADYRVDAKKSRFIVETETSGLSSMFGHEHRIEVREFSGAATFPRAGKGPASLELTVRADSLRLVEEKNIGSRQAVESALREEVLETARYPEIVFKSRSVTSVRRDDGTYDARIAGELRLHGVRKEIVIPARIALLERNSILRAIGTFDIRQTDFKITPFSFVSGTVTIKDTVTVSFDIMGVRS